jgi:hypothetical protein
MDSLFLNAHKSPSIPSPFSDRNFGLWTALGLQLTTETNKSIVKMSQEQLSSQRA